MNRKVKRFYNLAFDYHTSAVTLWTQITDAPYLYNPVSYLLRHTIELQLKGLIIIELIKNDKSLQVKDVRLPISNRLLSHTHSVLVLWESYLKLLQDRNATVKSNSKEIVDKSLKKLDKKDFSSTIYRYPFDRNEKEINIEPIDIISGDISPDTSLGIPYIIENETYDNPKVINKGVRLLQDTSVLFDIVEILFSLLENDKLIEIRS